MADELMLSGKRYTSSKRAAEETGYAQDYIGQLARGGHIDAHRVGGLWYVSIESLRSYKTKPNDGGKSSAQPVESDTKEETYTVPHAAHDEFVSFDGKDYISASRASKVTGYNQDYVGQLARSGKILARQVGNRWFVERSGIIAHKEQKDALLAAVQAQAVGLIRSDQTTSRAGFVHGGKPFGEDEKTETGFTYHKDTDSDLVPNIYESRLYEKSKDTDKDEVTHDGHSIVPIRRAVPLGHAVISNFEMDFDEPRQAFIRKQKKIEKKRANVSDHLAVASAALTVVIVLSFGISLYDDGSVYASLRGLITNSLRSNGHETGTQRGAMLGSAAAAFGGYLDLIEGIVEPGISYSK
ncbi:hypothetical protein FJY94_05285 [Candidatus Kaiserbacteria bacterium]|nr:hypothetical protein [Candidatus Kaiserbacteria bacterium]